ncbi:hypothetical protein KI387_010192, partial [Taxus chinensis]
NYAQDLIDDDVISIELDDNSLATNDTSNTTTFHEELTTIETPIYTEIPRDHDENSQESLILNQSISFSNFLALVQTYIEPVLDDNILPTSNETLISFQDSLSNLDITVDTTYEVPSTGTI